MDRIKFILLVCMIGFTAATVLGKYWFIGGFVAGMAAVIAILATKSTFVMMGLKLVNGEMYAGEILGWNKKKKQNEYIEIKNKT